MGVWEWITSGSVENAATALGLGVLAILFATDRILTNGQHMRRVADLVAYHERERAQLIESRDFWRKAAGVQEERAATANAGLVESVHTQTRTLHVLESLDRALPRPSGGSSHD